MEEAAKHERARVESEMLVDFCVIDAKSSVPVPVKPLEYGWLYPDDEDEGLDFGFIYVGDFYKKLLERNGIIPLTSRQWNFPTSVTFESHGIVGFPDEFTKGHPSSSGEKTIGGSGARLCTALYWHRRHLYCKCWDMLAFTCTLDDPTNDALKCFRRRV